MSQSYLKQREVTSVALLSKAMISNVKNNWNINYTRKASCLISSDKRCFFYTRNCCFWALFSKLFFGCLVTTILYTYKKHPQKQQL
jgi:hypothetical protein